MNIKNYNLDLTVSDQGYLTSLYLINQEKELLTNNSFFQLLYNDENLLENKIPKIYQNGSWLTLTFELPEISNVLTINLKLSNYNLIYKYDFQTPISNMMLVLRLTLNFNIKNYYNLNIKTKKLQTTFEAYPQQTYNKRDCEYELLNNHSKIFKYKSKYMLQLFAKLSDEYLEVNFDVKAIQQNSEKINFKPTTLGSKRRKYFTWAMIFLIVGSSCVVLDHSLLKYQSAYNFFSRQYDGEYNNDYMTDEIYSGILNGFDDRYTQYMTKDQVDMIMEQAKIFGFGYDFSTGNFLIDNVEENTSAANAGVLPGDIVVAIDGEELAGKSFDEALKLLENDTVNLSVYRPSDNQNYNFNLTKQQEAAEKITTHVFENNGEKYGYIKIPGFSEGIGEQFNEQAQEFADEGIDNLIIDLCDNPGGELEICKQILNTLIKDPGEPVIELTHHGNVRKSIEVDDKYIAFDNIKVLQNNNTASASEVLSLALKEYSNAQIIGQQSYGKGVGQNIFPLPNGGYAKITTFHWQTGNGESINKVGITPTITVDENYDEIPFICLNGTIHLGDSGDNVLLLNKYLYYAGYNTNPQEINCSEQTISALNQFCSENKLEPNSELDAKKAYVLTLRARENYLNPNVNPYIKKAVES